MSEWTEPDDGQVVQVVALNRDAGSVVLFDAFTLPGRPCLFACDHRSAQAIINQLEEFDGPFGLGERPPVYAIVEPWQMLG
jgi:hypothetical protein